MVTPPYRGINHIYIEGWHFRNSDNLGSNEIWLKNANIPQEVRVFHFVLNEDDYQKATGALDKILWPYSYSSKEVNEAEDLHERLKKAEGKLTIKDVKLNNLGIAKHVGMDYMKFDVEFYFPIDLQ